ncbi:hypothetical protein VB636_00695, partial [Paracoccus sp. APAP_BH8]
PAGQHARKKGTAAPPGLLSSRTSIGIGCEQHPVPLVFRPTDIGGMMMVPPVVVALPFKLAFFVVVDGWGMIAAALVRSYQ